MVLGNMITNKSYDKRYDVPLSISCKRFCSLHTSLGRKRTVTSVKLIYLYLKLQVFTEVSEGEVKIWVFFLLNKTSVLYVEYKMILFAWSFCMNIYFIFFFSNELRNITIMHNKSDYHKSNFFVYDSRDWCFEFIGCLCNMSPCLVVKQFIETPFPPTPPPHLPYTGRVKGEDRPLPNPHPYFPCIQKQYSTTI